MLRCNLIGTDRETSESESDLDSSFSDSDSSELDDDYISDEASNDADNNYAPGIIDLNSIGPSSSLSHNIESFGSSGNNYPFF